MHMHLVGAIAESRVIYNRTLATLRSAHRSRVEERGHTRARADRLVVFIACERF